MRNNLCSLIHLFFLCMFHVFFVACTPTVFTEGERREGEREGGSFYLGLPLPDISFETDFAAKEL